MKKVLSFVLVLAMILGSVSMAFAAPKTTASKAPSPFEDAETSYVATILRDLGVLTGSEGKALLDETITRAELCAVLVRALGYEAIGKVKTATKFTDVPETAWYSGYVAVAYNLGYVDGVTAKTFMPEASVTGYEAVAFVIKALGYQQAHLAGSWPTNYIVAAQAEGILGDVAVSGAEATREDVFTLLFNALDNKFVAWDKTSEVFAESPAKKSLAKCLGLPDTVAATYRIDKDETVVALGDELANGDSLDKFAGKDIKFVTKDGGKIGVSSVVSTTLEGKLETLTLAGIKLTGGAITGAKYFVNGYATNDAPANGTTVKAEVKYSDSKKNVIEKIYSVSYEQVAGTVVISNETTELAKASSKAKIGTYSFETTNKAIKAGSYTLVGVDSLADIEKNDVVEVYLNENDKITKLVVTQDRVEGKVTRSQVKADGFTYVTVDGQALKLNDKALRKDNDTKVAYTYLLNSKGVVVAVVENAETAEYSYTYAFVLDTQVVQTTSKADGWGQGTKDVNNYAFAIKLVDFADDEELVYDVATAAAVGYVDNQDTPTKWSALEPGQLIKYALDDDDVVVDITKAALANKFTDTKPNTNGIGSYRFASDVEVVFTTAGKTTSAAFYETKAVSDIAGKTVTGSYSLNKSNQIDKVIIEKKSDNNATYITGAAIVAIYTEGTTDYVEVLADGKVSAIAVASGKTPAKVDDKLRVLTLVGGKFDSAVDFTPVGGEKKSTENMTFDGYSFATVDDDGKVVAGTVQGADEEVAIVSFDKVCEAYDGDVEDALDEFDSVYFYDLDNNGFVDTILVFNAPKAA